MHPTRRLIIILPVIFWLAILFGNLSISYSADDTDNQTQSDDDEISIYQIDPDKRGGNAYKLVYLVRVPIECFWTFKTDFDSDFLTQNKYIRDHKFISKNRNTVITENKYSNGPDVFFRWQTTVHSESYQLDFVLLNPEQCKQKYHYGSIQLEPVSEGTLVTQVAYFDFWGSSLWAHYPWRGGMREFLSNIAHWEQETILDIKSRYCDGNPK